MPDDDAPQFDLPFRLGSDGQPVETPQDELQDVTNCVQVLIRTPLGFFPEQPDYGTVEGTFEEEVNLDDLQAAISQWEERADDMIEEDPDMLDYFVRNVNIKTSARSDA